MRCLLQKLIRYWIEIQSKFFCFKFNLYSLLMINTMLYTDKRTTEIKEGITERINNAWRFTTFCLILQKHKYLLLTLRSCAKKSLLHTMQKFQRGSFCTFIQFFFLFFFVFLFFFCFFVLFLFFCFVFVFLFFFCFFVLFCTRVWGMTSKQPWKEWIRNI